MTTPRTPVQDLRKFIVVFITAGLFVLVLQGGIVAAVSERFAQKFVEETVGQSDDRTAERVAQSTFVPLVREQYPAATAHVLDPALVGLAVDLCSGFAGDFAHPDLHARFVDVLPEARVHVIRKALRDAVHTTCPWKRSPNFAR